MRAPIAIPKISPISRDEFWATYVKGSKPVVITDMINDWPALKKWSPSYFGTKFHDLKIGSYVVHGGHVDVDANSGLPYEDIPMHESISSIIDDKIDDGLTIASLINKFPDTLKEDYKTPDYCADEKFPVSRIFIGPKGVISPLHQDIPENLYVMVQGRKKLTLFSPSDYVYPARFSKMPNHAYVDPENPDYSRYPLFKNAQPYEVELSGGETLFIPSLWWHHLHNLESSIAVNFWWSQGWKLSLAFAASIVSKIRASRIKSRK